MGDHPIHPATVHFPIAFIALTGFLDIVHVAATNPPTSAYVAMTTKAFDVQLPLELLPLLSYYTTVISLITMVPAILSGVIQLPALIQKHGFGAPKVKTAITHAGLNDVVAFSLGYNWWTRRDVAGFAPSATNLVLSGVLAVPVVFFAGKLGADLVYHFGMGVGGDKSSAKAKKYQ